MGDAASAIQSAWNSHHRQDADQTKVKAPKGVEESGVAAGSVRQTPTQMDKKKKPEAEGTQKSAPPAPVKNEDAASAIQSAGHSHHRQDADQTKVKAPEGVEESGLAASSVRQTPTQLSKKKKPKAKRTPKRALPTPVENEDAASAIQNSDHRQGADKTKVKAPEGVEESGLAARRKREEEDGRERKGKKEEGRGRKTKKDEGRGRKRKE